MRSLATAAATSVASGQFPLVLLVEMGFSPIIYLASSAVDVAYSGNTYLGAGSLGAVDVIRDSSGEPNGL